MFLNCLFFVTFEKCHGKYLKYVGKTPILPLERVHVYLMNNNMIIMDHLHWQCLLAKPSVTATYDGTCLGHLGRRVTDRIISI